MTINYITHHFETIDSTNTWAKRSASSFDRSAFTLVTADQQTAGRGRFNRKWLSPSSGNLYASFCHFVNKEKDRSLIGHFPQLMALAVASVLEDYGFSPLLKWPNDVLIGGKKVTGILCETVEVDDLLCVINGVGLNINMTQEEIDSIDRPATSMFLEGGDSYHVDDVLHRLCPKYFSMVSQLMISGFSPFLFEYRKKQHAHKGERIRFHDNLTVLEGTFEGINDDGTLTLSIDQEGKRKFVSGEFC